MKTSWKFWLGDLLLIALVGLALAEEKTNQKSAPKPATPQKVQTEASPTPVVSDTHSPIIGYIERRDQTITIRSGPKGAIYSVKTKDGKVLFENLSAEQLQARAPELHDFIKTAVAGKGAMMDAKARPKMDASIGLTR
jgi:hypothetical protein